MVRHGPRTEDLESWIQMLGDKDIKVDVDRVTRFAISKNQYDLVRYLVEHQDAQLKQRDKFGRSAVFYAAACADHPKMLRYVASTVGFETIREAINYHDAFDTTPLYYAAMKPSIANVEYCLSAGARPDHDLLAHQSQVASRRHHLDDNHIRLLFTLYGRLRPYGNLPVYIRNYDLPSAFPVDQLHAHLEILSDQEDKGVWMHIPWTNVS